MPVRESQDSGSWNVFICHMTIQEYRHCFTLNVNDCEFIESETIYGGIVSYPTNTLTLCWYKGQRQKVTDDETYIT